MANNKQEVKIRELALEILIQVLEKGSFLNLTLHEALKKFQYIDKKDRAFLARLCEGTVERAIELDYILDQFSNIPSAKMKPVIRNILRMAVYQMKYMDQVPDRAAIDEAVKLSIRKGFQSLKGFVNGVLRAIGRKKDQICYPKKDQDPEAYLSITYSLPRWMVEKWSKEYGLERTENMGKAFLKEKKTTIRCSQNKISPQELKELLTAKGIKVRQGAYLPYALCLSGYDSIEKLPGFREGYFFVQDESSMLAAEACGIQKDFKVIDLCASPGGKSLHIAEKLEGSGMVSARDVSEQKTVRIEENKARLSITNLETLVWDGRIVREEDLGQADVVVADLPCSGLGVLGRKPDIKYRVKEEGLKELVRLQRELLQAAQGYVKKGGALVYSTCTLNPEENLENRKWFLENFKEFRPDSLTPYFPKEIKEKELEEGYVTILPGVWQSDGFFITRFVRD